MKFNDTRNNTEIKVIPKWWEDWFNLVRQYGITAEIPVVKAFVPDWSIMALIPEFNNHLSYLKKMYNTYKDNYKIHFIETYNGKYVWKKYDKHGKIIYMSPLFDTEEEARYDYDNNLTN